MRSQAKDNHIDSSLTDRESVAQQHMRLRTAPHLHRNSSVIRKSSIFSGTHNMNPP